MSDPAAAVPHPLLALRDDLWLEIEMEESRAPKPNLRARIDAKRSVLIRIERVCEQMGLLPAQRNFEIASEVESEKWVSKKQ